MERGNSEDIRRNLRIQFHFTTLASAAAVVADVADIVVDVAAAAAEVREGIYVTPLGLKMAPKSSSLSRPVSILIRVLGSIQF